MPDSNDPGELLRSANPVQTFTMASHRQGQMISSILEGHSVSRSHSGGKPTTLAFAAAGVVACIALALILVPGSKASSPRSPSPASLHLKTGQALSSSQEHQKGNTGGPPSLPGAVVPVSYVLSAGPELPTTGGSSVAYDVSWPDDMTTSAVTLAQLFGVGSTQPVPNGLIEGGVLVGSVDGPNVDVYGQDGVLNWTYQDPTAPASTSTPTGPQATADALALLAKIGITQYLGTPQVSPNLNGQLAGDIAVAMDVVIDGDETGFNYVFVFGAGGSLVQSEGQLVALTSVGSYPTISPTQAVGIVQDGTTYVPENGAPTACGVSGTPPCQETVNTASIRYQGFDAADGSFYLLPAWELTGVPSTRSAPQVGAWVIAIDSQFVSMSSARAHS